MLQYNFTSVGSSLIMTLVVTDGDYEPKQMTFMQPSLRLATDKIRIYESGTYATAVMFHQIGTIGGFGPTDLQDANDKLLNLIPSTGASSSYNTVTAYDTVADLPIDFASGTIHSISILAQTGSTTIQIGDEETTLIEGQSVNVEADGLISDDIKILSCTGTFLATVIS
jgi:hypothetical protein